MGSRFAQICQSRYEPFLSLYPSKVEIAGIAQDATNRTSVVIMVNAEERAWWRQILTQGANSALTIKDLLVFSEGDAVRFFESTRSLSESLKLDLLRIGYSPSPELFTSSLLSDESSLLVVARVTQPEVMKKAIWMTG